MGLATSPPDAAARGAHAARWLVRPWLLVTLLTASCNGAESTDIDPLASCSVEGQSRGCYAGPASARGVGVCVDGAEVCQQGRWGACEGSVLPTAEQCNDGVDNDCDGAVDEDCPCETGESRPCYGGPASVRGIGICVDGTQHCLAQLWADECEGDVLPLPEDPCNSVDDDCDGMVATAPDGTTCCTPACEGKLCGSPDGCGGSCSDGSGCCTPHCAGKLCGTGDGCGGICSDGSGCCTPHCAGKLCGEGNGCGGLCSEGSGCCAPSCVGKSCGESDGCGESCAGSCPFGYQCTSDYQCVCGPSPHFLLIGNQCLPSCGVLLDSRDLPNEGEGCCASGCLPGTFADGPGSTHDCNYCCSSSVPGSNSCELT